MCGFAVVACGDSTGPTDFDPLSADSVVTGWLNKVEQNRAVHSLSVLGSKLGIPSPGEALGPRRPGGNPIPILEPGLGRTLVFNPETDAYEFGDQTGDVPANGVRFVLYAIDGLGQQVALPLDAIGDLDLTDESPDGAQTLGVESTVDGVTALDYTSTASGNLIVSTLVHTVNGAIADDVSSIGMDLDQRISQAEGINIDYRLTRGSDMLQVQLDLDSQTGIATTTLTVRFGGTTFTMTASGTPQAIEGEVRSNGTRVARIGGSATTPVFTDTDGIPITGSDLTALRSLFGASDRLFNIIDDALSPSYWVFGLDIIFGN